MNSREALMTLSTMHEFPMDKLRAFLDFVGGEEEFFSMSDAQLEFLLKDYFLNPKLKSELLRIHHKPDISELLRTMEERNYNFITEKEAGFPQRLKAIKDAPLYLYYKGQLISEKEKSIAIIGARNCSAYGKEVALCFSRIFAKCGITVVSGMARGIDGFAHEGTLEAGGRTVAVLGFGLDNCYPKENYGLMQRIQEKGCLVSEYAPGVPASPLHFPARNRLISALSDGLLVIEAAKKSGTLITVDFALEQGKNIYTIPGRIGDVLSEGCNELIKNGCTPVTDPKEILSDFGYESEPISAKVTSFEPNEKAVRVLATLCNNIKYTEEILQESGIELSDLLAILLELELKGYITQPTQGGYIIMPEYAYKY